MTKLQAGIQRLDAVRVGRGVYAYYDDTTGALCVADSADVRGAGAMAEWDYDAWCGHTFATRASKAQRRKYEG